MSPNLLPVLGYGTNGFTDHTLNDMLDVVAGYGYEAIALTLGHPHFDPFADEWERRARELRSALHERGMRVVVETGARYLLDPYVKHHPTLVDREASRRLTFLARAIEIAGVLDADCVSLWSGVTPDDVTSDEAWSMLVERMADVVALASVRGVQLGFEPEPGMRVETVADALALREELGNPDRLGITVDLGHCVAVEPGGVVDALRSAGDLLVNVQVDDMMPGVHEHLELGTGQLDLALAFRTLSEIGYDGVAAIELPRHSHAAPRLARESMERMREALNAASESTTTRKSL
ncbi:sugar phosphate isomerase/epimerase [Microbacteriaceae bacterium SG_E_30_P1]|uniref:Sugar phosphate isomerase/epimerase n=1 Tax=Antiquaquibacter oligotrophicus TaxID=2880260 RepID=A0ABT6KKX3_9MICO|nr:sugar phosphate isomerase/epimerase family protein [Antiquaquibacter oligotrophicus]MDH6180635.1 sugar phosphate isomerase/epimerase [Antiquaquibacter oligotrophicus]UDF13636.1 sugar phosphate isomerase/epimerase [Antiquaquibacter oligotrophicus]